MNETRRFLRSMADLARRVRLNMVFRAGAAAGLIKGFGLIATFLLQIVVARLIADPAQYGAYAWGQNLLFLLGSLFALGIPIASSRLTAVHHRRGDARTLAAVRAAGIRWLALTSAGGAAISAAVVLILPESAFAELSRSVALIAVLATPLVSFMLFGQALSRAHSRLVAAFVPTQLLRPVFTGILVATWVFWIGGAAGAESVLLLVCASLLLVLTCQALLAGVGRPIRATANGESSERAAADGHGPERLMSIALPMFATRVSDLVIRYGSVVLLGMLAGPSVAAGFFVADRLAQLGTVPRSVIASVVQPWLAQAHADGDHRQLQQVVNHAGHAALWPTLAAVVGLLLLGPVLLGLFGGEYRGAFGILVVLLAAHLLGAALGPAQQVLMMSGQQKAVMRVMALSAICHIAGLFILIPWLGALGAAVATLLSTTVARLGCLRMVRSRLGIEPSVLRAAENGNSRRDGRRP